MSGTWWKKPSQKRSETGRNDIATKPIILVDCSSVAYAALYSTGFLSYMDKPTGIVYGFLKKILLIGERFNTNRFMFCWDWGSTHRSKIYPEYKAKRHTNMSPEEVIERKSMLAQMIDLRGNALRRLGFGSNYIRELYEADDLLCWWANKLEGEEVILVTTDSDMYQCLERCRIYFPNTKKTFTKKDFRKKYGIEVKDWPMAKAIGGCSVDEVDGIVGVSDPKKGTSKALKFIRGEITGGIIHERITSAEGQKIIARNLALVSLPYMSEGIGRMVLRRDTFSRKKFIEVFDEYRFKSFLERETFDRWEKVFLS